MLCNYFEMLLTVTGFIVAISAYVVVANQRWIQKVDVPSGARIRNFSSTHINVTSINYHLKYVNAILKHRALMMLTLPTDEM